MDVTELELQKLELQEKIKISRNAVEACEMADKIRLIDKQIEEANFEENKKEVVPQKEAPARADHKNSRVISRGSIANSGNTFVGII